jgi:hypothetical protein
MRGAESLIEVTFVKSRMRESRTYGSVRAKAEWLSYSTTLRSGPRETMNLIMLAEGVGNDDLRTAEMLDVALNCFADGRDHR